MFGKLFKPRWQHQNVEVRLKAIALLDENVPEQREALLSLAHNDGDSSVRRQAVARLADPARLIDCYRNDSDEDVRNTAANCLLTLLGSAPSNQTPKPAAQALVQQLDSKLLIELLSINAAPVYHDTALALLDDSAQLLEVALNGHHAALRERAADKIIDADQLRQLGRQGRDKKVLQLARDRLKQLQQQQQHDAQQRQDLAELLQQIEQHAKRSLDPLYEARTTLLREHWQALANYADSTQALKAEEMFLQAEQKLASWQQQEAEKQAREVARQQRQYCLENMKALIDGLDADSWSTPNALMTAWRSLQGSWQDAVADYPADAAAEASHDSLEQQWKVLIGTFAALQTLAENWQTPASDADLARLRDLLAAWPKQTALPAAIDALQPLLAPAAAVPTPHKKSHKPRHLGLLHRLRQALKARHLKEANRAWQRLNQALEKHPDASSAHQAEALKPRLDELRDWHAFAAMPKKQQLCERMQQLVIAPLAHPEEQANAIQALHDQWHELMSSDQVTDQSLWDSFKQASDSAYAPCRDYFKELDKQRAINLEHRVTIVSQLNDLLEKNDWENLDGQALWQIRRQAPKDWQQASPVAFTEAREVNQRFHQQLKEFDAHLKRLSDAHQPELEQLLDTLAQLAQQQEVVAAARSARRLQQDWRSCGWVHPQSYRKLDKRRRQLCDTIFARLHEQQAQRNAQQQQLAASLQAELATLDQLLAAENTSPKQLDDAIGAIKKLAGHDAHAAKAIKAAQAKRARLLRRHHWQRWQQLLRAAPNADETPALRELCVALEASAGCDSPANAKAERLAWQVDRLADAMKRSQQDHQTRCLALLEDAQQLIDQGLDNNSRERLLNVIESLIGD